MLKRHEELTENVDLGGLSGRPIELSNGCAIWRRDMRNEEALDVIQGHADVFCAGADYQRAAHRLKITMERFLLEIPDFIQDIFGSVGDGRPLKQNDLEKLEVFLGEEVTAKSAPERWTIGAISEFAVNDYLQCEILCLYAWIEHADIVGNDDMIFSEFEAFLQTRKPDWHEIKGDEYVELLSRGFLRVENTHVESEFRKQVDFVEGDFEYGSQSHGVSYDFLFGKYLEDAKTVTIVDPNIREGYQVANLFDFFHCVISRKNQDLRVLLKTQRPTATNNLNCVDQEKIFVNFRNELEKYGVEFFWDFLPKQKCHDRSIMVNDEWRIRLGRGLDIYQYREVSSADRFGGDHGSIIQRQEERSLRDFHVTYIRLKK